MLAIAVAALVAVFRPQPTRETRAAGGYQPGEAVDIRKIPVRGPTLLIATRSTCGFCTDSIPFWRTLAEFPIVWLAVGEDPTTNRKYLLDQGLQAEHVTTLADAGATKIGSTPTILLIDKDGVIKRVWVGLLAAEEQADVRSRFAAMRN